MKDPLEEAGLDVDRSVANRVFALVLLGLVALFVFKPGSRTPLLLVAGIVLMVMLHEAGHLIMAKRAGMKVTEFFVGFGPRLWSFRRGETEYGVKALPLGGYVRIIGMSNLEEVDPDEDARTFRRGSTRNRLKVILAGVTVNILIALLLFFVVIAGQGHVLNDSPSTVVSGTTDGGAAQSSGFRTGDKIIAIDGKAIHSWDDLRAAIESHASKATSFVVERKGDRVPLTATPQRGRDGRVLLGIIVTTGSHRVSVLEAVPETFKSIGNVSVGVAEGFGKIFSPSGVSTYSKNFTSPAPKAGSASDVERPRSLVGIVDEGSQIYDGNLWGILWLLGAISLVLALFNLLPLLPFDGGHAAVVLYEAVASKVRHRVVRVDFRKLMPMTAVVLAIFLTLGVSAMYLDIRQLGQ